MYNRPTLFLLSLLLLATTAGWAPAGNWRSADAVLVPAPQEAATLRVAEPLADYKLYLPSAATTGAPVRLLVALHGMGGNGPDFAAPLLATADRLGWAVLAPTMPYRDFKDPEQVRRDGELLPRLKALIDALPARSGVTFDQKVLLFGFSRGSQEAHRFSLMYPDVTLAVAGMSAGSYTLPQKLFKGESKDQTLLYPFGSGDLDAICGRAFDPSAAQKVRYWIGVGGRDNRVEDVPRQWDTFVGKHRVERAQRFVAALQALGASAEYHAFPNADHEVTDEMRERAFQFLRGVAA
jgi:poly(3-hydroxybutyrate) depolymerase